MPGHLTCQTFQTAAAVWRPGPADLLRGGRRLGFSAEIT